MKTIARFFLFIAAVQLAFAQPTVPVSNLSPLPSGTVVGRTDAGTGRATTLTAGTGITIANGQISSSGGAGDAPAGATYITQTPNATLTAEQPLSLLASGLLWSTTGTGVITSLTMSGDATLASNGALTLANSGASAGTYGSATVVPVITVDAKGRITAASNTTITATGNVTAAGTLDSGNIVIGQGAKTIATSSVFAISGSNATVTGNLTITGGTTFNNLTTSNLTVTGNIVGNLAATQVTIADAGGYYTGTEVESALQEVGGNIVALQSVIGPTPSGNQLISGGGVALAPGGGLDITVSAASYLIQGTSYTSALTNLTLSAADPSNPRIDVIAVNSSGNAVIIEGTPAATPAKPDVDPSTQLELTFFLVGAGATDLDVDVVDVYLNNAEWTTSTNSAGTINVASTNNPYTGALCIEGTTVATGNYVRFVKPASGTFDLADSDNLVFYIRSKASWANNRIMSITVRDASSVQLGSAVTFDQGLFGFNSGQTTTYQQIIIPTALFAANGLTASQIQITVGGSGGTIGFYIDDVTLQGGVASITDASRMKWRGNYLASNFYNVNDVVLSSGIQYVAIQAGVGNTPASSPTFWQASSSNSGGTVTGSGLTTNAIVIGGGGSAITIGASPGTSGNVLTSNGTAWVSSPVSGTGNVTGAGTSSQAAEWTSTSNITGVNVIGSGNYVKDTSPSFQGNITVPSAAAPSTGAAGATAFDNNAWAASRGAVQVYDGTANTFIVGALASDTPSNGQVPTWNTGGTITWETPTTGSGTVNSGTANRLAYYAGSGTAISDTVVPVVEFASSNNVSAFTMYNAFRYPFAKSDTTGRNIFWIGSNDGSNPFGLGINATGNATATSRVLRMDVGGIGVNELGQLHISSQFTSFIGNNGTSTQALRITPTDTLSTIEHPASNGSIIIKPNGSGYVQTGISSYTPSTHSIPNMIVYPFAKTDTSARNGLFVASNDSSNPWGVIFNFTGNATSANREMVFKMTDVGASSAGKIRFGATSFTFYSNDDATLALTINTAGALVPNQTAGIVGTTTNNNVNAGSVGEYVQSLVAVGSAVSLTTATTTNVTSISLTAGDWDVEGIVNFSEASATVTQTVAAITSTSATLPTDGTEGYSGLQLTVLSATDSITLPRKRFSLSGTTTVYLVARPTFTAGTVAGFGYITGRRVR